MAREQMRKVESSITGTYQTVEEWRQALEEKISGGSVKFYDRSGYPELAGKEDEVADIVGVEKGNVLLYNSGMSAIHDVLDSLHLTKGDVLLYSPHVYGSSRNIIETDLQKRGIKCIAVNPGNWQEVAKALDSYHPKAFFMETVGNDSRMPVVALDNLLEKSESLNQKYQQGYSLDKQLQKQLSRKPWIKEWLGKKDGGEDKMGELVKDFVVAADEVKERNSAFPLRELMKKLNESGITLDPHDKNNLREVYSIVSTALGTEKSQGFSLILDNTLATESNLPLGEKIKDLKTSVQVVESGTKLFAHDKGTMGLVYSNDSQKILDLKLQRIKSGGYLPPAVLEQLPELKKDEFDVRNKTITKNTLVLAECLALSKDRLGIKAVSHPNLPGHPNFKEAQENYPDGSSVIFYANCEDSFVTAEKIKAALEDDVEIGVSFGFEKMRIVPLPDGILRIAGGNEDAEKMLGILKKIESA